MKIKDAALVGVILLFAVESLLKDEIHFRHFNWPTLVFYTLLIACCVTLIWSMKPLTRRFWIAMIVYVLIFLGMALYPFYRHLI